MVIVTYVRNVQHIGNLFADRCIVGYTGHNPFSEIQFKNIHAIIAEVAGIKKNTDTVLLAELCLIKYIKIVKAPKETNKIWWLIAIIKVEEKSM